VCSSDLIGYTNQLSYFISSKAGDNARIWVGTQTAPSDLTVYINAKKNISGPITTVGGDTTRLVFVSSPTSATVGISDVSGAGAEFTLERRDDFDNVTRHLDATILLKVGETSIHTNNGRTQGLFGNVGDYGFRDKDNTHFLTSFVISDGYTGTETKFRFHDRLSSYSGTDPDHNTSEGGRPGKWTLQAWTNENMLASHQIRLDPAIISKINFGNSQNTIDAGKTKDHLGALAVFRAQLQDLFDNPVAATQTYTVRLATVSRVASHANDYVGFSTATDQMEGSRYNAPAFNVSTETVTIPLNAYQATFYYIDTTASSRYSIAGATRPLIGLDVTGLLSATQPVLVTPGDADGVAVSSGLGQVLPAGTTDRKSVV
jgi:hypothetical protein